MAENLVYQITSNTVEKKLNHKKWRYFCKKQQRRLHRQNAAKESYQNAKTDTEEEENADTELENDHDKNSKLMAHVQWVERERLAQEFFAEKKKQEEAERKKEEEKVRKIQEEWEECERNEKKEQELRSKLEEKRKQRQEALLKEATSTDKKEEPWHNPLAPRQIPGIERKLVPCPFFAKTGACRFYERCSRDHNVPDTSQTIVFPNMYNHFSLDQALRDEYDTDINLEYEESDTYKHFIEFYDDVLPEFRSPGNLVQFKVCRNFEHHLKGNVYVQYSNEEEALRAYALFNARWYGGRQIGGRFVDIPSWRAAICGLYLNKKCPKGKSCNFLHIFSPPGDDFDAADNDFGNRINSIRIHGNGDYSSHHRNHDRYYHSRSNSRSKRSRSRSRSKRSRSRSRSRCRDQSRRRYRTLIDDGHERYDRHSRERDHSWRRSRHGDRASRERDQSKRRSRERDESRRRSRDRDRTNGRSRDREVSRRGSRDRDLSSRVSRDRDCPKHQSTEGRRSHNLSEQENGTSKQSIKS